MTAQWKANQEEPVKIPLEFDDAMKRALAVKPPPGGWVKCEKKLKRDRERRRSKATK